MIPRAYYNEKDAYAAQWLRKLAPRLSAGDKRRKVRMGIKLKFEYQPAMENMAA